MKAKHLVFVVLVVLWTIGLVQVVKGINEKLSSHGELVFNWFIKGITDAMYALSPNPDSAVCIVLGVFVLIGVLVSITEHIVRKEN